MRITSSSGKAAIDALQALIRLAACAAALLLASQAQAQPIYRTVGPDGKISFTDKPPAAAEKATTLGAAGKPIAPSSVALPTELRQVAEKYPVTLYTTGNCTPCDLGRKLLSGRGIPFAEKTVSTAEDAAALQRISGETALPFLSIGAQQIKGFSDSEWGQFLDAAGYPQSSALPASYRNPPATPLVVVQKVAPLAKPEEPQPAPPSPPAPDPSSNPAGIRF